MMESDGEFLLQKLVKDHPPVLVVIYGDGIATPDCTKNQYMVVDKSGFLQSQYTAMFVKE